MGGRGGRHRQHLRQGHRSAQGGKGGARVQGIGPSRGGQTTKIHVLTDVLGRPGVLLLTPGNASDVTAAPAVLAEAPVGSVVWPPTRATMPTGSGPTYGKKASRQSSPASAAASGRSATTNAATANAGGLKQPSIASRTSVASPPATTSWPETTSRPSHSLPSSPSGADRVQTLGADPLSPSRAIACLRRPRSP